MKKVIIALLITALVSGFVFAGTLTGDASLVFDVNLQGKTWGFSNPKSAKYTFNFEFDSSSVEVGEHQTELWAEIAASVSASAGVTEKGLGEFSGVTVTGKVNISKANIHIGDITIGILNAGDAPNYAKTYYKTADNNKTKTYVGGESQVLPGFTVDYKGWNGGFGANGAWNTDPSTYDLWGHAETAELKFAEDAVAIQAGGYARLNSSDKYLGASALAKYTSDKFKADAAVDVDVKKASIDFAVEAAANATVTAIEDLPITLNVYFVNGALFAADSVNAKYVGDYAEAFKLDAKLSTSYTFDFNDESKLAVAGFAEVRDALINALELSIGATETMSVDKFTIALGETVTLKNLANKDAKVITVLGLDAKVTYTADKFTAWAQVKPEFTFDSIDNNEVLTKFGFECEISSTAIIENATVALGYKKADFAKSGDTVANKGVVSASVKVTF